MRDTKTLLDNLKDGIAKYKKETGEDLFAVTIPVVDIIPKLERLVELEGWIPCNERLPNKEAKEYIEKELDGIGYLYPCLLTYRSPNTEKIHVVRFYYDIHEQWFVNIGERLCEKTRCIAWMPIPEPCKEE